MSWRLLRHVGNLTRAEFESIWTDPSKQGQLRSLVQKVKSDYGVLERPMSERVATMETGMEQYVQRNEGAKGLVDNILGIVRERRQAEGVASRKRKSRREDVLSGSTTLATTTVPVGAVARTSRALVSQRGARAEVQRERREMIARLMSGEDPAIRVTSASSTPAQSPIPSPRESPLSSPLPSPPTSPRTSSAVMAVVREVVPLLQRIADEDESGEEKKAGSTALVSTTGKRDASISDAVEAAVRKIFARVRGSEDEDRASEQLRQVGEMMERIYGEQSEEMKILAKATRMSSLPAESAAPTASAAMPPPPDRPPAVAVPSTAASPSTPAPGAPFASLGEVAPSFAPADLADIGAAPAPLTRAADVGMPAAPVPPSVGKAPRLGKKAKTVRGAPGYAVQREVMKNVTAAVNEAKMSAGVGPAIPPVAHDPGPESMQTIGVASQGPVVDMRDPTPPAPVQLPPAMQTRAAATATHVDILENTLPPGDPFDIPRQHGPMAPEQPISLNHVVAGDPGDMVVDNPFDRPPPVTPFAAPSGQQFQQAAFATDTMRDEMMQMPIPRLPPGMTAVGQHSQRGPDVDAAQTFAQESKYEESKMSVEDARELAYDVLFEYADLMEQYTHKSIRMRAEGRPYQIPSNQQILEQVAAQMGLEPGEARHIIEREMRSDPAHRMFRLIDDEEHDEALGMAESDAIREGRDPTEAVREAMRDVASINNAARLVNHYIDRPADVPMQVVPALSPDALAEVQLSRSRRPTWKDWINSIRPFVDAAQDVYQLGSKAARIVSGLGSPESPIQTIMERGGAISGGMGSIIRGVGSFMTGDFARGLVHISSGATALRDLAADEALQAAFTALLGEYGPLVASLVRSGRVIWEQGPDVVRAIQGGTSADELKKLGLTMRDSVRQAMQAPLVYPSIPASLADILRTRHGAEGQVEYVPGDEHAVINMAGDHGLDSGMGASGQVMVMDAMEDYEHEVAESELPLSEQTTLGPSDRAPHLDDVMDDLLFADGPQGDDEPPPPAMGPHTDDAPVATPGDPVQERTARQSVPRHPRAPASVPVRQTASPAVTGDVAPGRPGPPPGSRTRPASRVPPRVRPSSGSLGQSFPDRRPRFTKEPILSSAPAPTRRPEGKYDDDPGEEKKHAPTGRGPTASGPRPPARPPPRPPVRRPPTHHDVPPPTKPGAPPSRLPPSLPSGGQLVVDMPPMGSSDPRFGRPEGPQIYGQPGGIGPFAPKIPRPNESAFHLLSSQGRHDRLVEAAISNWVPNNPNGDANENELEADNMIEWHYRMRDTIDLPLPPRHWSDKLHGLYTEITQQRVASMLAGAYAGNMTPQPINDSYVYNKPVHTRDMNTLEQEDMSDAYPDVASLNAESGSRSHVESYRPY